MPSDRHRSRFRRAVAASLSFALAASLAACGDDASSTDAGDGTITVFAAASLTSAFEALGEAFTASTDGAIEVVISFAASSELVAQIGQGAPADVFASADRANMEKLVDAGNSGGDPVVVATNVLEIIVGPGNPAGITGVADLANQDLVVVVCAPEVPCGRYANDVAAAAGVTMAPRSLEQNVKGVVSKVTSGEADAGIVYRTDVIAAGDDAEGVEIPDDVNVIAEYPIAVTKDAANPAGAQAFIDFVLSDEGQAILASYGFRAP